MNREINQNEPFDTKYFNDYYKDYRNKKDDLFESEKYFLDNFLENINSVLDVGCATGGMYSIISELNSEINYTGVDVSANLINEAKKLYPGICFQEADGISLPFASNSFDGIISFGTTVHDQNWENLLLESFRVTRKSLLFDIRLTNLPTISKIEESYVLDGSNMKYPYVVINIFDFLKLIKKFDNTSNINIYGYSGQPNNEANLPSEYQEIFMCGVYINKQPKSKNQGNKICLNLPLELIV